MTPDLFEDILPSDRRKQKRRGVVVTMTTGFVILYVITATFSQLAVSTMILYLTS